MGIIQISMLGIGAVVLALLLKQQKSEYALYLSLAAVILILIFSMNRLPGGNGNDSEDRTVYRD